MLFVLCATLQVEVGSVRLVLPGHQQQQAVNSTCCPYCVANSPFVCCAANLLGTVLQVKLGSVRLVLLGHPRQQQQQETDALQALSDAANWGAALARGTLMAQ
jgi:hypothetical protein